MRRVRRTVQEKLHSRRGASLLFAFLFLLVASMVSTVILSGAVTAIKRAHDDTGREQSYLTLESAARLFREMLQDTTVTVTVTVRSDGEKLTDPEYSYNAIGPLKDVMAKAVEEVYEEKNGSTSASRRFVVTAPEAHSERFQPVQMELTLTREIADEIGIIYYLLDGTIQRAILPDESGEVPQKLYLSASYQANLPRLPTEPAEQEEIYTVTWDSIMLYTRPERRDEETS